MRRMQGAFLKLFLEIPYRATPLRGSDYFLAHAIEIR